MKLVLISALAFLLGMSAFTIWASPDSRALARYWAWESKLVNTHYWKQKSQWK